MASWNSINIIYMYIRTITNTFIIYYQGLIVIFKYTKKKKRAIHALKVYHAGKERENR